MSWTDQYSALDRFVHRAAFAGTGLQKAIADIEDTIFQSRIAPIDCDQPVFITSLPRAGTTLLLEVVSGLPSFAAHTYRSMPFLFCPLLWDQLTHGFRKHGERRERAHGDGMLIDFDSAEAFEEALWQAWWPAKYRSGRIQLWSDGEADDEFDSFFRNHLRKVIALARQNKSASVKRYVSKNNANIARLPALVRLFPDCSIVVPIREPVSHVMSLHRQHQRFLKAHAEDEFARTYMRAIGHLDFGANLAPIDFPGFAGEIKNADQIGFWLDYWVASYASLADVTLPQVTFVSYEALCADPVETLSALLRRLGERAGVDVEALAGRVQEPVRSPPDKHGLDPSRLAEARTIYQRLVDRSI